METAIKITNWLSLTVIVIAFFFTLHNSERKNLIPIKIYIILSIVANLIMNVFDSFFPLSHHRNFEQAAFNICCLLEISLIYYFLFTNIKGKWFRAIGSISLFLYISICVLCWLINDRIFYSFTPDLLGVEGLLITGYCLFYIYEILRSDINTDLKTDANFIVTCGILFYFSLSVPTYFSWYNLHYLAPSFEKITILANSIFYTILFISFIKAYLCPIPNRK
jgi:hypothetical protein